MRMRKGGFDEGVEMRLAGVLGRSQRVGVSVKP